MARVVLDGSQLGADNDSKSLYWQAENHNKDNYLRAENWLPDVEEFTLTRRSSVVRLGLGEGTAMLRFREETKMRCNLNDHDHAKHAHSKPKPHGLFSQLFRKPAADGNASNADEGGEGEVESLHDAAFLDKLEDEMWREWEAAVGGERPAWFAALRGVEAQLDAAIAEMPNGAFVKLSVRSPKDSVFDLTRTRALIQEYLARTDVPPSSPLALSDDVLVIKRACWEAMRVRSGREALRLLLRSERVYIDLLQHELFNANKAAFDLAVHVFEFVDSFDPNWEFRGFVCEGQRTALTAYNPWVYEQEMVGNKDKVLGLIVGLWDQVQPRVKSANYSIDFALSRDLAQCWIVEINNFLPPLAGSGLFDMHNDADVAVIHSGPFEFRIKDTPLVEHDFVQERVDKATGKKTTLRMMPAPQDVMDFVRKERERVIASKRV